jgi:hypothetical protein
MRPSPLIGAMALAVSAAASAGQVAVPEGASAVHGRVLDAASGRPIRDAWVCARIRVDEGDPVPVCTSADSTGRYRLASLPGGPHPLTVTCPTDGPDDRTLAAATVPVPDSAAVERDWRVAGARCLRQASRLVSGDFDGHYTAGFETSLFVPCPADRWTRPGRAVGDAPGGPHQAWVTPRDTAVFAAIDWPPTPDGHSSGDVRYFVRWRGTVEGPGRYGHMGLSAFQLTVDSVMELRIPDDDDCEGTSGTAEPERTGPR